MPQHLFSQAAPTPISEEPCLYEIPSELEPGIIINQRYRVVSFLGKGSAASVYQVYDNQVDVEIALKLLQPQICEKEKWAKRIKREVKIARLLNHPNLAQIYDVQVFEGTPFITMELIRGQTLAERLNACGALELAEAQTIIQQLCAGLEVAHAAGIVHRDLKPANIMLEKTGRVVILDFGVAKGNSELNTQDTLTHGLVGTPYYMAPEQFQHSAVDHRADIYALGLIAFEVFTGTKPFKFDNFISAAFKRWHEDSPNPLQLRPDLPPRVAAVVARCLKKNPEERINSVSEISSLLSVSGAHKPTETSF